MEPSTHKCSDFLHVVVDIHSVLLHWSPLVASKVHLSGQIPFSFDIVAMCSVSELFTSFIRLAIKHVLMFISPVTAFPGIKMKLIVVSLDHFIDAEHFLQAQPVFLSMFIALLRNVTMISIVKLLVKVKTPFPQISPELLWTVHK